MDVKNFESFVVRSAKNGVVVEPANHSPGTVEFRGLMLFTDFQDFLEFLRTEIELDE